MIKAGLLYHNMRYLLKNKNAQITVKDSQSPIPEVEKNKKNTPTVMKREMIMQGNYSTSPANQ